MSLCIYPFVGRIFKSWMFVFCCLVSVSANCQYDSTLLIDDYNINEMGSPFQLTCIHEVPINKVDSLIAKLIWNGSGDSLQLVRVVDQLGATKSSEAYCILFSACCRPIMVHDLNMFNSLAATLS